jgi:hypothetical protein
MTERASQDKKDRLKAALRENLKRRKAQTRGREATLGRDRPEDMEPGDRAKRRPE